LTLTERGRSVNLFLSPTARQHPSFPADAEQTTKANLFADPACEFPLEDVVSDQRFQIALLGWNREKAYAKYRAAATYTFAVSDGPVKTHAEVVLTDGGFEIIEREGKDARAAARLALERLLRNGCDPFEGAICLQVPYREAEYFSKFGNFLRKFPSF
jgi:hypothetical protein